MTKQEIILKYILSDLHLFLFPHQFDSDKPQIRKLKDVSRFFYCFWFVFQKLNHLQLCVSKLKHLFAAYVATL